MNIKINSDTEFLKAIDAFGKLTDLINAKKSEAKIQKELLELYARENSIRSMEADSYRLTMKRGSAALRMQPGLKDSDVIALLEKSELGRGYIIPTYDSAALKRNLGSTAEGRDELESFGLKLTEPQLHAEVRML